MREVISCFFLSQSSKRSEYSHQSVLQRFSFLLIYIFRPFHFERSTGACSDVFQRRFRRYDAGKWITSYEIGLLNARNLMFNLWIISGFDFAEKSGQRYMIVGPDVSGNYLLQRNRGGSIVKYSTLYTKTKIQ